MPTRKVPPEEVLKELYEQGLSAREISIKLGINKNTIASALRRYGISNRTSKEAKAIQAARGIVHPVTRYWLNKKQPAEMVEKRISKIRGKNHYLWKGGKSKRDYRGMITKEKCENCDSKYNLGIHHKDFDHYNNVPENLEVLCVSCHMSLHKQAYWDAIKNEEQPPRSNGPVGWKKSEEGGSDVDKSNTE